MPRIFLTLLIIFLISVIAFSAYQYLLLTKAKPPRLPTPTPTTPTTASYTCPANGWVDCMPSTVAKPECSAAAMAWYKANCSNFKGAAL